MAEPVKSGVKPHLKQFFDVKEKGETPPLNEKGFWKKPEKPVIKEK